MARAASNLRDGLQRAGPALEDDAVEVLPVEGARRARLRADVGA